MKEKWIVEEVDSRTLTTVYIESFDSKDEALDAYTKRKSFNTLNTVSLTKAKNNKMILEEKNQKNFLLG